MKRILPVLAAVAALAACGVAAGPTTPPPSQAAAPATATTPPETPSPAGSYPADWPVPDKALTPGAVATTDIHRLCPHVDPALEAARPTSAEKARVYAAYNLAYPQPHGEYELDHLIPIELGGAPDDPANEWPERNDPPDPAMAAKWHLDMAFLENPKDEAEDVGHLLVCDGRLSLAVAQQAMATGWRAAYAAWVEGMQP